MAENKEEVQTPTEIVETPVTEEHHEAPLSKKEVFKLELIARGARPIVHDSCAATWIELDQCRANTSYYGQINKCTQKLFEWEHCQSDRVKLVEATWWKNSGHL
mmetsp:Transcript_41159/g.47455  ORF Transcript_41159/g.47455 Transcript_41159/m.47455 type:complete len:104 (+) Transcript_41159:37-348(+)